MRIKYLSVLLICSIVFSCSLTSPREAGNNNMLRLDSIEYTGKLGRRGGYMMVNFPKSHADLDTYRIAIKRNGTKRDYYAGARWAEFLPLMVQSSLISSIDNAKIFSSVVSDTTSLNSGYQLHTEIREFEADYTQRNAAPTVVIDIHFHLANTSGSTIKHFATRHRVQAKNNDLDAVAHAFKQAFRLTQEEMVRKLAH